MAKLSSKDDDFLKTLLAEYATLDKLSDVQRVIIALNANDKKSSDDYKSLRSLLKSEKDRIDNQKLIADILAKQDKLKSDAQAKFTTDIFNAVENKKFVTGLVDTMSVKQILQKLIDDKIVSSNAELKQYLKISPDIDLPKSESPANANDEKVTQANTAPDNNSNDENS